MFPLCWTELPLAAENEHKIFGMVQNGHYSEIDDYRYQETVSSAYASLWIGEDQVVLIEISH
jgi:hypothetical protein